MHTRLSGKTSAKNRIRALKSRPQSAPPNRGHDPDYRSGLFKVVNLSVCFVWASGYKSTARTHFFFAFSPFSAFCIFCFCFSICTHLMSNLYNLAFGSMPKQIVDPPFNSEINCFLRYFIVEVHFCRLFCSFVFWEIFPCMSEYANHGDFPRLNFVLAINYFEKIMAAFNVASTACTICYSNVLNVICTIYICMMLFVYSGMHKREWEREWVVSE